VDDRPEESLGSFLDRLANADPAPGGGAAAALTAAAAAAVVAMVCRVTVRREAAEMLMTEAGAAERLRQQLMRLVRDDSEAYAAVVRARRASPEQRPASVQAALERATEVPLNTAEAAAAVLETCARIVGRARRSTLGDLGVAAGLAGAAAAGALMTAELNLAEMDDGPFVRAARERARAVAGIIDAHAQLVRRIATRAGLGETAGGVV
jgi:formiminotetrahydrofolate cyclodeaminase